MKRDTHIAGVALSIALHSLVVGLFIFWGRSEAAVEPIIKPEISIMKTELVRLGKKRPKTMLPRLYNDPAPKAPKAVSLAQKVDDKPEEKDEPKKKKKPEPKPEPAPKAASAMDILNRFSKQRQKYADDAEPEGDPNGSMVGTASTGRLRAVYGDQVTSLLANSVQYSGVSNEELAKLTAKVRLEIDKSGKIKEHKLVKPSGDDLFDASALRAVRLFTPEGSRVLPRFPKGATKGDVFKMIVVFDPE